MPCVSAGIVINLAEDQTRLYNRDRLEQVQTFPGAVVAGSQSEYFVIDAAEQRSVVGIQFRPGGAYPFLGVPAGELHNRHVPLEALWGGWGRELRERLLEAPTPQVRLAILEEALLARARRLVGLHPAVNYALGEFRRGPRTSTVTQVTDRIGLSPRRFIEVFRDHVGLTPKLFCRVERFQRVLGRIAAGRPVEWAEVALDAGYFDQPHFIHDFRSFSGISPSVYAELRPQHQNHVPLRN